MFVLAVGHPEVVGVLAFHSASLWGDVCISGAQCSCAVNLPCPVLEGKKVAYNISGVRYNRGLITVFSLLFLSSDAHSRELP